MSITLPGRADYSEGSSVSTASPEVSVIIVSYNTRALTLACIKSVYEECLHHTFEIIVVDNASSDGSADAISDAFPSVHLISLQENIGFGRANNLAVERSGAEYILLLNPDTLVLDHAIDRLLRFAKEQPRARIWGGRTLFEDRTLNSSSCWRRMTLWSVFCQAAGLTAAFPTSSLFNCEAYGGWQRDTVRQVDIVTGCFLLLRRDTWNQLGGFDNDYFMYAEEADLCQRARSLGARPMVTPDAYIVHYDGASDTVRSDKLIKLIAAKMTFSRKHWSKPKVFCARILFMFMVLARAFVFSLAKSDPAARAQSKSRGWWTVWLRRQEWVNGYPSSRNETSPSSPKAK